MEHVEIYPPSADFKVNCMNQKEIIRRARKVRAVISDVDGVLTDGGIMYGPRKLELKRFHTHDGLAVKLARKMGLRIFLISGRSSHALRARSAELGVDRLWEGVTDKVGIFDIILKRFALDPSEVCAVGDDIPDIPLMRRSALGVAASGASPDVVSAASYVTRRRGGDGALREVVELILRAQGKWEDALRAYNA